MNTAPASKPDSKRTATAKASAKAKVEAAAGVAFTDLKGDDAEEATEKDEAKAVLETQLQAERDARSEERFVWIVVVTILVDVLWFRNAANALLPLVVLILELIVLLVLARRMGIDDVVQLVDRILHSVGRGTGGNP